MRYPILIKLTAILAMLVSVTVIADDRIKLEDTEIQGVSELPKVLYIVPWKRSVVDNSPVEVDSMVDQVMQPIDREVLRRQVKYYKQGIFAE